MEALETSPRAAANASSPPVKGRAFLRRCARYQSNGYTRRHHRHAAGMVDGLGGERDLAQEVELR